MYTEKELEKLINDVEQEFTSHLAKAEENFRLAKSETSAAPVEALVKAEESEKKPPAEDKKPEEKKPESKGPEEKAPEAAKEGEKKPEGEAPPAAAHGEHKPEGEAQVAPAQAQGGEDQCDYDDADRDHMQKMYMSMSKGELKAHHDSCRAALDTKGMAKCGDMSMSKSETAVTSVEVKAEIVKPEPNKELELLKSEIAAEKAKTEGLQKSLDAVSAFLTKLVEKKVAPQGKAITSMDVIAKSENAPEDKVLTKGEIDAALSKKSMDPKLEKSERDLINAYYLSGASINSISHLLK